MLHFSGHVPWTSKGEDGTPQYLHVGKLGAGVEVAEGQRAARCAAEQILCRLRSALGGDLGRVVSFVRPSAFK